MQLFPVHLTPRGFALANPLPLVPRAAPRPMPPRPVVPPPLLIPELGRAGGAGVANLDVDLEETGGFSTNEVSVVLIPKSAQLYSHPKACLHECGLSIEVAPPIFAPALPHHSIHILLLPCPRKRICNWSLPPRISHPTSFPPSRPLMPFPAPARNRTHLREVHTKGIHIQPVQKTRKALAKPGQTLMHELKVHKIRLQVSHAVRELGEGRLEGGKGRGGVVWSGR